MANREIDDFLLFWASEVKVGRLKLCVSRPSWRNLGFIASLGAKLRQFQLGWVDPPLQPAASIAAMPKKLTLTQACGNGSLSALPQASASILFACDGQHTWPGRGVANSESPKRMIINFLIEPYTYQQASIDCKTNIVRQIL